MHDMLDRVMRSLGSLVLDDAFYRRRRPLPFHAGESGALEAGQWGGKRLEAPGVSRGRVGAQRILDMDSTHHLRASV